MATRTRRWTEGGFALLMSLALFPALTRAAGATPQVTVQYWNVWSVPSPGGVYSNYYASGVASSAFAGSTDPTLIVNADGTTDSVVYENPQGTALLSFSAFGQPVESSVAQFQIGDVIPWPPQVVNTNLPPLNFEAVRVGNNTNAYYQSLNPTGAVIYLPSTHQVIAAAGGNVVIDWPVPDGGLSTVYTISSVPATRPARVFWTEPPYNAPAVQLLANGQQVFACIHYNNYVSRPVLDVIETQNEQGQWVTSTHRFSGVWIDGTGLNQTVRAVSTEGFALIEYYTDGSFAKSLGVQPIQVMPPNQKILQADIGSRLVPEDQYYGLDDLEPNIRTGGGEQGKVTLFGKTGPKYNWVFAIQESREDPWDVEIYWQHQDWRGVVWPFEVDWYQLDWPDDALPYVLGNDADHTAAILVPSGLTPAIPFQEPAANVSFTSSQQRAILANAPGLALLQFTSTDDIWFQVIRAVQHDDPEYFDPTPVTWPIGEELRPYAKVNHVLLLNGTDQYVEAAIGSSLAAASSFTVEAWVNRSAQAASLDNPILSRMGSSNGSGPGEWELAYSSIQELSFRTQAGSVSCTLPPLTAPLGQWHHVAGVFTGTNVILYVNGLPVATNAASGLAATRLPLFIGRSARGAFFAGSLDEIRLWSRARTAQEIVGSMNVRLTGQEPDLAVYYPLEEGRGTTTRDLAKGGYGTLYGNPRWLASFHLADSEVDDLLEFPGYVYTPSGTRYNVNRYAYPTEADPESQSHLFAVNTGPLEVWWASPTDNLDMPVQVYVPSLALRYQAIWPTNAPTIVLASGLGSGNDMLSYPSVYYQNDPQQAGYNPNEEHALVLSSTAYALRDDLNQPQSSEPYVLIDALDPETAQPVMLVYRVVRTDATHSFEYPAIAAGKLLPPMPLAAMPLCTNSFCQSGPGWRDRKNDWWAKAAGDDASATNAVMGFFYTMEPGFFFPARPATDQPAIGSELPWLPIEQPAVDGGAGGTPLGLDFVVQWPENLPELKIAQTLTMATEGLPDIWNQLSVDVLYQQSQALGQGPSVTLFDPLVEAGADLPIAVINELVANQKAQKEATNPRYVFPGLPPSLRDRVFYDPYRGQAGQLVLGGLYRQTLTGGGYLLLNLLEAEDEAQMRSLMDFITNSDNQAAWTTAVSGLPTTLTPIYPDQPYVKAALSTAISGKAGAIGYVTLAFNNSANPQQVPPASPITLTIVKVVPELDNKFLDVILSDSPVDEQLSLRYALDFGGQAQQYEFEWRWAQPLGGLPPNLDFDHWNVYGPGGALVGQVGVEIEGSSPFVITDNYFACRYRRHDGSGPTGSAWSDWEYNFAPGWVQRVMNGINPFEQRFSDMTSTQPNLTLSMISEAGRPYQGDIALNPDALDSYGLIEIYQTVFNRSKQLTLDSGMQNDDVNQTMLFAATRLCDLYMLLGNEAFADAQDPTIGFGTDSQWYENYGSTYTSLFCFMNQAPDLLTEELDLLCGRVPYLDEKELQASPVFNRLFWNFTHGIDGGEVAYATTYSIYGNVTNTSGQITVDDAQRAFPQGHGDAWGHYLSAMGLYYQLLSNTNFGWQTWPGATLVGNATVITDFYDEQKFAEAAAAKARTGAEIVERLFRKHYQEGTRVLPTAYSDGDTNRAWGLDGWAARAGQGAFFDWVTVNSLLLDSLTNMVQVEGTNLPPVGVQKIDRTTVPELAEVSAALSDIQENLDSADQGLNPLGLDPRVVPFDISPGEIDDGKTHFEQAYERALAALNNAASIFAQAQGCTDRLREQAESAQNRAVASAESEVDYHNQLVQIYGYPYEDDIGAGRTYPQGYDGPDLVNYQIVDLEQLIGTAPAGTAIQVPIYNLVFHNNSKAWEDFYEFVEDGGGDKAPTYFDYTLAQENPAGATTNLITVYVSPEGFKVKPASWTGHRPAQGEIQMAWSDYLRIYYQLQQKVATFNQKVDRLDNNLDHLNATADRVAAEWAAVFKNSERRTETSQILEGLKITKTIGLGIAEAGAEIAHHMARTVPSTVAGAAGISSPVALEIISPPAIMGYGIEVIKWAKLLGEQATEWGILGREGLQERWNDEVEIMLKTNAYKSEITWGARDFEQDARELSVLQPDMLASVQELSQAQQRVLALLRKGERVIAERAQVRSRAAQRLQMNRYGDMGFRIFRNDALQRYDAAFDLAARYVYLAAKAYDYETGLLESDTEFSPGCEFLTRITRARAIGRLADGSPQPGGSRGDPGLADALARMKADWDVIKGRAGFNNPDTETSQISLRTELFRIIPNPTGNTAWRDTLEQCRVDNLYDLPEFRQLCVPFSNTSTREPALVIPFASSIVSGLNFFGLDLAGGDNAFDPTHGATKVRAVGIWFSNYNNTFSSNAGSDGLANQPRVYLIPVGEDIMRSPTRNAGQLRSWRVLDQALPLPFDLGDTTSFSPDWIALFDSLPDNFAAPRRYTSLRAYHDRGDFDESEICTNARLVGRSIWNTRWLLIVPGRTMLADADEAIDRFIYGLKKPDGDRDGNGISDIKLLFRTYSYWGM